MADKEWEEMTLTEKCEHLSSALQSVVGQLNIVNGNVNRRLSDLEAKVAKLDKG